MLIVDGLCGGFRATENFGFEKKSTLVSSLMNYTAK